MSEASPTLGMRSTDAGLQEVYRVAQQGSPTMGLYDADGKVRVRLGLAAEGSPVLRLLDRDGQVLDNADADPGPDDSEPDRQSRADACPNHVWVSSSEIQCVIR